MALEALVIGGDSGKKRCIRAYTRIELSWLAGVKVSVTLAGLSMWFSRLWCNCSVEVLFGNGVGTSIS